MIWSLAWPSLDACIIVLLLLSAEHWPDNAYTHALIQADAPACMCSTGYTGRNRQLSARVALQSQDTQWLNASGHIGIFQIHLRQPH